MVSFEAVLEAKRLGLDVVITDHHMPDNRMIFPKADAIVNPWAETGENQFGSKNLCGAGVAWYVMACVKDYLEKRGWKHSFAMKSLVDILAVATVGDMVRLDDNNIKLVKLGLEKMNSNNVNPGIAALMDVSKYNEKAANTQTIGFGIGPMLNSCGRLGSAERAMTLLCTDDYDEAFMLASELKETNDARKLMQKQMSELAIDNLAMDVSSHSACIFNPEFNEGVVGLIASKVKDLTNLPSCVFTATEHGYIKGSFRSVPGVHIRDVIDLVSQLRPDIKLSGGGHAASAGAKCDPDKWDIFKETFNQAVIELAEKDAFNPTLMVDGELKESDINMRLAEDISTEVWGQGMAAPLFAGPVEITDQKILKDAHCKFTGKIGRLMVQGIFFGRAHFLPPISNLVYALDINVWNGNKSIQLLVQGIDESQEGLFA
ncbi:MAG: single-stranded-DNA-specific exonuclease RecJ [Methylophilus sp.]|uniref:single-stranded-DNA-specific exonuclease RecJ n=1 Tax=Methylophilus sp. TaxID=29541 RepID=UPI003F9F9B2E